MSAEPCWRRICAVDAAEAVRWLLEKEPPFPEPSTPAKPQRVFWFGPGVMSDLVTAVLAHFPGRAPHQVCLSRVRPGQRHPLHVDVQRSDWVTRVHVPLVTNPGAWMLFEEEGERVHFEAGHAYTFNTLARHAFGNDGDQDRTHLIFDVLRADG